MGSKSAILFQRGPVDPKFRVEGVVPTNHSSQKTKLNVLSCDRNLDRSFYRFVTIHACDRRTDDRQIDRRTDRILIARQRLHSMQRGKNLQGNSHCLPRRLARMVTITSLYSHQFR